MDRVPASEADGASSTLARDAAGMEQEWLTGLISLETPVASTGPATNPFVAQWIEQFASNEKAGGSTPSEGATVCTGT